MLSNHLLNSPWPKAILVRRHFFALVKGLRAGDTVDVATLTRMLRDTTVAGDEALPATGPTLEREQLLSSPFIISPDYGTRCTTAALLDEAGTRWMAETRYGPEGRTQGATFVRLAQRS